jgi:hypothetical protein
LRDCGLFDRAITELNRDFGFLDTTNDFVGFGFVVICGLLLPSSELKRIVSRHFEMIESLDCRDWKYVGKTDTTEAGKTLEIRKPRPNPAVLSKDLEV